jgi:hypothetical protein
MRPDGVPQARCKPRSAVRLEDMIGMGYFPDEVYPPFRVSGAPLAPLPDGGDQR